MEEIGQEIQGGIHIRVGLEGQVGSPFLQVEVRVHERKEQGR